MTMVLTPEQAILSDLVGVEDADALREWCAAHAGAGVDLSGCTHLHAANLQVLMASCAPVIRWPDAPHLAEWLRRALPSQPTSLS